MPMFHALPLGAPGLLGMMEARFVRFRMRRYYLQKKSSKNIEFQENYKWFSVFFPVFSGVSPYPCDQVIRNSELAKWTGTGFSNCWSRSRSVGFLTISMDPLPLPLLVILLTNMGYGFLMKCPPPPCCWSIEQQVCVGGGSKYGVIYVKPARYAINLRASEASMICV